MELKKERCPKCGIYNTSLPSNNPLIPNLCVNCIKTLVAHDNLEQADFFCRTYNVPFNPSRWIEMSTKFKDEMFVPYIRWVSETYKDTLYWNNPTEDLWKKVNEQWKFNTMHEEIIAKIAPIKDGYILRNKIKWGVDYTFEELIMLENLFVNTIKAHDVNNPMQIDAIKKSCKMSIMLDRAIVQRDSKEIKELTSAYSSFIKTANIAELIITANRDVITTVADLCDFIEKNNFQMPYYDNVERDIVDVTINDMKDFIRTLVADSVGLELTFETINNALRMELEGNAKKESFEKVSLEDLYKNQIDRQSEDFDSDLSEEESTGLDESLFEEEGGDDYEFFGS